MSVDEPGLVERENDRLIPPPIHDVSGIAISATAEMARERSAGRLSARLAGRFRPRRRIKRRRQICLNCDAMMSTEDHYCSHCGQENVDVNISIWEIVREGMDEFVRVDSKFFATIRPLIRKPGLLTQEWARGRRARYISPLKLYLTITAVYFLVVPYIHPHLGFDNAPTRVAAALTNARPKSSTNPVAAVVPGKKLPAIIDAPTSTLDRLTTLLTTSSPKRNQLVDQMIARVPTALFVMLPLFAGVLWVLYIRNDRYYVEHLVFALHCHAYYFLLMTFAALVPTQLKVGWAPQELCLVVFPIYSWIALKRNYGQGWFKTTIKAVILGYAYCMLGITVMLVTLYMAMSAVSDTPASGGSIAPVAPAVSTPVSGPASTTGSRSP